MADQTDPIAAEVPETVVTVAVAAVEPVVAAVAKPVAAPAKAPVPKAAVRRKPASIKKPAVVVKKAKPAAKPAAAPTAKLSVTELKDKIMASKTTDFTATISKSMTEAVADMQGKAQAAYDKGTGLVAEMTDLAKGNVEAVVESGKILASGIEGLTKSYTEEAKSAYETLTADIKEMAAIKSPTELFQLQGKIMRRNFDVLVATSSKSSESAMKLATDAFAPVTARVNLAVEKLSKAA
jgi:phasin family protein